MNLSIILTNKELRDPLSSSARSLGVSSIQCPDFKFVRIILEKMQQNSLRGFRSSEFEFSL